MQSLHDQQEVAWMITWVKCPTTGFKLQGKAFLQEPGPGSWGHFYGPFLQRVGYSSLNVSEVHLSHGSGWLLPLQIKQGLYIWFSSQLERIQIHVSYFQGNHLSWKNTLPSFWMCSAKPKLIKWKESMNTKTQKGCRAVGYSLGQSWGRGELWAVVPAPKMSCGWHLNNNVCQHFWQQGE